MMGIIAKYDLNHFFAKALIRNDLKVFYTIYLP
jgi:hypothetical protein